MLLHQKQKGIIALMTVLIIGALALTIGIAVGQRAVTTSLLSLDEELSARAYNLAHTCAEKAVLYLVDNHSYGGNETVLVDAETCTIDEIQTPGANERIVHTWSQVGDFTRRIEVVIDDITASPVSIGSWREVSSF